MTVLSFFFVPVDFVYKGTARMFLLRLKEIRGLSVKMADVSQGKKLKITAKY